VYSSNGKCINLSAVRRTSLCFVFGPAALAASGALSSVATAPPPCAQRLFSGLRWRLIGPFRGGRVNAVSGVPGEPETFYFGAVGTPVRSPHAEISEHEWTDLAAGGPTRHLHSEAHSGWQELHAAAYVKARPSPDASRETRLKSDCVGRFPFFSKRGHGEFLK